MVNNMDTEDRDQPAREDVLGRIEPGERDTKLDVPAEARTPPTSHRRGTPPPLEVPDIPGATPEPAGTAAEAPRDQGPPALPRGGLVVMRRSGGLKFSSREVVVYRDGRVVYRRHDDGLTIYKGSARRLDDDQLALALRLVEQAQFPRFGGFGGRQPPDALAYEIVARVGRRLRMAEVFQGTIPESLAPLIAWLNRLMAEDERIDDRHRL
jgi:hypothetical protein